MFAALIVLLCKPFLAEQSRSVRSLYGKVAIAPPEQHDSTQNLLIPFNLSQFIPSSSETDNRTEKVNIST